MFPINIFNNPNFCLNYRLLSFSLLGEKMLWTAHDKQLARYKHWDVQRESGTIPSTARVVWRKWVNKYWFIYWRQVWMNLRKFPIYYTLLYYIISRPMNSMRQTTLFQVCWKREQDQENYLLPLSKNNLKLSVTRIDFGLKMKKTSKISIYFLPLLSINFLRIYCTSCLKSSES